MSGTAVIVLNYQTAPLAIECLHSLAKVLTEVPACRTVVVDNASCDDSADQIAAAAAAGNWDEWMSLVRSPRNLGFAGGNNLAMRGVLVAANKPKYVLLLNSDTVVHPGTLAHCLAVMEEEPDIGMMSCQVLNSDGTPQNVSRRFPTPLTQVVGAFGLPWILPRWFGWANVSETPDALLRQKRDCDWIGGAFMFIRREALDCLGGLDEDFFFYGEDIEFCHRFHKAGYRVHYDPGAAITHLGGASSDPTRVPAKARTAYAWRARYLVQRKCYGAWAAWLVRAADVVALGLRKVRMMCRGKRNTEDYRAVCDVLHMLVHPLRA